MYLCSAGVEEYQVSENGAVDNEISSLQTAYELAPNGTAGTANSELLQHIDQAA